jgi:uncharacterized protein YyaL (SSP411 family)
VANRLANARSPYLLQHKDNPVHWWPWRPEAFEEAKRRNVPVFLSVGYAACHWCHVMAHESFEDPETALLLNDTMVSIKVDREERPDVDAVYMEATQAMTGQGGWPMTCFLTPEGEPFFCGTYFPKDSKAGMPSFTDVVRAVSTAWNERRDDLREAAGRIVAQLSEPRRVTTARPPTEGELEAAVAALRNDFDAVNGGFGHAPKFPPAPVLEFLLRCNTLGTREMVTKTCETMARGGIYDQLAGGFARYSVDHAWVVPHFEKMLYDNAQLTRIYAHLWRATGNTLAKRIAVETADWMLRDLRTTEGGFASALDADTNGIEGLTYVWTRRQLVEVLGEEDGRWAAALLQVTEEGTFEHGTSTLQLLRDPDDPARWANIRGKLLEARNQRPQPARDDKVVASWNGLAIAALAEVGALFDRSDYIEAARDCARLLLDLHLVDGRLRRVSRDRVIGEPAGVLEDYAFVADGLLALAQVRSDAELLHVAGGLLDVVLHHFADGQGGFYDTADDAEALVRRPQDPTDGPTPAGQSAVAGALLTYAALTGSQVHREAAERALAPTAALAGRYPRFMGGGLAVAAALLDGPAEIAIVGDSPELVRVATRATAPGAVVALGPPGQGWAPLLDGRELVGGASAAYVCRSFICQRPVTDAEALEALVRPQ